MKNSIIEHIDGTKGLLEINYILLTRYFKDITIPLEERWEVFEYACSSNVYNNISDWIWHNEVIEKDLNLCYYSDLYIDRYQTCHFTYLISALEERLEDPEYKHYYGKIPTIEQINQVKEDILKSGYVGFIMDW